jgi:hypothetical protein
LQGEPIKVDLQRRIERGAARLESRHLLAVAFPQQLLMLFPLKAGEPFGLSLLAGLRICRLSFSLTRRGKGAVVGRRRPDDDRSGRLKRRRFRIADDTVSHTPFQLVGKAGGRGARACLGAAFLPEQESA